MKQSVSRLRSIASKQALLAARENVLLPADVRYALMLWSGSNGRKLSTVNQLFCCCFVKSPRFKPSNPPPLEIIKNLLPGLRSRTYCRNFAHYALVKWMASVWSSLE